MKPAGQILTKAELQFLQNNENLILTDAQYEKYLIQKSEGEPKVKNDHLKDHVKNVKNICINGKDPEKLSTKEQLQEFVKGPCLPIILVPGLMATKLQVIIDCQTLKEENPDVFKTCGWYPPQPDLI